MCYHLSMENNTGKLWFRRKRYGWGWTPSSWQGWAVTLAYIAILIALAATLDENSENKEVAFMFFLPVAIMTAAFIRIAYKKGEKPRWQWGKDKDRSVL